MGVVVMNIRFVSAGSVLFRASKSDTLLYFSFISRYIISAPREPQLTDSVDSTVSEHVSQDTLLQILLRLAGARIVQPVGSVLGSKL